MTSYFQTVIAEILEPDNIPEFPCSSPDHILYLVMLNLSLSSRSPLTQLHEKVTLLKQCILQCHTRILNTNQDVDQEYGILRISRIMDVL